MENEHMNELQDEVVNRPEPTLEETLEALRAGAAGTVPAVVYYGLSGLSSADLLRVKPVWGTVNADYRRKLLNQLVEIAETNVELDYRGIGRLGLVDVEADVREAAIELLWEDESLELMSRLIRIAFEDNAVNVRAAAASALGRFILLGELGGLPERETERAQDAAIRLLTNPDEVVEVRRRALEAISNCSHDIVEGAINEAYHGDERPMQVSALFAMGRSCDDERWSKIVLSEIESADAEKRYEAARAAGELEIVQAVPLLARLTETNDRELKEVAIWSLGEIGGKRALKVLNRLADEADEAEDDELLAAVEDAIGNASLVDGELLF
jgi:HEAT repeat protein